MEEKVQNINVEKNKELFEYEMTEVILKLKGELSTISGKATRFAGAAVDDRQLVVVPHVISAVSIDACALKIPKVQSINFPEWTEVVLTKKALSLPSIPAGLCKKGRLDGSIAQTRQ